MFRLGIAQCFDSVWLKRSTKKPANGTQQKGVGYTALYTLPSFREKTKSFTHLHRPHAMISGAMCIRLFWIQYQAWRNEAFIQYRQESGGGYQLAEEVRLAYDDLWLTHRRIDTCDCCGLP
jgi:hypothetical protein